MKLVAVSVVRNESDIVEAFVRHTASWVDHHLILDLESTDGTRQILAALKHEGLAITLYTAAVDRDPAHPALDRLKTIASEAHAADWVLPLSADDFLAGSDRAAFEHELASVPAKRSASIAARNYACATTDDAGELNPVLRIRHRQHGGTAGACEFTPGSLVRSAEASGRSDPITLSSVWLCRFTSRSAQQQVLQVVTGELQRLSHGRAHAGLNTHNRLGYQLLAEDPDTFFSIAVQRPENLVREPFAYRGGLLRYHEPHREIVRSARALLPFLESLARSHGRLLDQRQNARAAEGDNDSFGELDLSTIPDLSNPARARFSGFVPVRGWQPQEGPVPSAFLPAFHWATAPETALDVHATADGVSRLRAEALTYAERQVTTVVLNGRELLRHVFTQVNQKETLTIPLQLKAGVNRLVFRHRSWLHSRTDPRKLAIIFLSLQVDPV